jgi:hypothetical protein
MLQHPLVQQLDHDKFFSPEIKRSLRDEKIVREWKEPLLLLAVFFDLPGLGSPYPVLHQWNKEPFVPHWVPKETTFLCVEAAWLGGQ